MKKVWREWRGIVFLGFVILLLAVFLRIYRLTYLPIFADEAIYIRWAQVMRAEPTLRFLPLSDGKQPLFMWSVIPFLKIFNDPLYAGRFLSVVTGTLNLIGVFVLSFYLFGNKKASLVASLIYAVSPFFVFYDRMALVDSMLAMFAVWTLFFALVAARTLRLDFAMIAGFSLGGAFLTKSPALFFALLLPTTVLVTKWPKKSKQRLVHLAKLAGLWVVTLAIGYGFYNILRLGPEFHMISLRSKDYIYPLSHIMQRPLDPLLPYLDRILEYFWMLGPAVLVIFVILGALSNFKAHLKQASILLAWSLVPIFTIAEYSKTMTTRYIYFTAPFLIILAASAYLYKNKVVKYFLTVGMIVFVFHSLLINRLFLIDIESAPLPRSERSGYLEEWTAGTGIWEVAEHIREEKMKNPDEKIVVGTEGFFGTLPDGLQIYLNDLTDVTVIGVGVTMTEVHPSLIESKQAGNKTYLVVNSSRIKFDAKEKGLELLAAYPKAFRADNTHEYTQNGPRDYLYFLEVTEKTLGQ